MTDDQHANCVLVDETKQDSVRETIYETAANTMLDNGVLCGIRTNSCDGRMGLRLKLVTESSALLIVVCDGVIEIGYGERVIFNRHSDAPPVRSRNSA